MMLDEKKQAVLQLFLDHALPQDLEQTAPRQTAPVTFHINIQSGDAIRNGTNTITVGPLILNWPQFED